MQKLASTDYLLYLMKLADYRRAMGQKLKDNLPVYEGMVARKATSDVAKKKPFKPEKKRTVMKARKKVAELLSLKLAMTPGMRSAMPWMKKAPKTPSGRMVATPKKMDVHKYRPKSKELAPADESIPAFVRRKKRKSIA